MPLFELKGMDDSSIFVPAGAIARFKAVKKGKPAEGTKVDYAGKTLFTLETATALAARLKDLAPFVKLTLRIDMAVWINAGQVVEVRDAIESNGDGTELRIGGAYQHVVEGLKDVVKLINAATNKPNA